MITFMYITRNVCIMEQNRIGAFEKELQGIFDGFGYEWRLEKGYLILDLNKKNKINEKMNEFIISVLNIEKNKHDEQKTIQLLNRFSKFFFKISSALKMPLWLEIFADIIMMIVFMPILYELWFRAFNSIGVFIVSLAIGTLFLSMVFSFRNIISMSDEQYLSHKFKFKREGNIIKTKYRVIARMKRNRKLRDLSLSLVFIIISVYPLFFKNQTLSFINNYLNLAISFLVIFISLIYWKKSKFTVVEPKVTSIRKITFFFSVIFFSLFLYGLSNGQKLLIFIIHIIVDIIVIYSIFMFLNEIKKTKEYSEWINER